MEYFLRMKLKDLICSEFGRVVLSGHANAAKDEMAKITEDFRNLVKKVKTDMRTGDYLYKNSFGRKWKELKILIHASYYLIVIENWLNLLIICRNFEPVTGLKNIL